MSDVEQRLPQVFVTNNFHGVGADVVGKTDSFGAIADFRLYSRTLDDQELMRLLHQTSAVESCFCDSFL